MRRLPLLLAALLIGSAAVAEQPAPPPEPEGYHTGDLRGATPATLHGASVVDLAGFEALVAAGAILVDVGPADVRPATMPKDALWLPTHRSVPGARWFPGAGVGDLPPERAERLADDVAALAGGDHADPVAVFCRPACWASWNAGKRLVAAGFTAVSWFPGGVEAWQEAHPTAPVKAMPGWGPPPAPGG